jgi:spermidine synthase
MLLVLFFGSGATALVYEVVWTKFLAQIFGSTIYAQTAVLAAFMGGLALGNRIFGGWADGLRKPVKTYGVLEILIGVYALFYPSLDRAANQLFIFLGTPIAEHAGWLLLLKAGLSAVLLLGPTILMGGTLPLLAAWLHQFSADAGRRTALFYSVNSLGAVTGAAMAGFWLVERYGMVGALQVTAAVNLAIGLTAILISRSGWLASTPSTATEIPAPKNSEHFSAANTLRWAGLIVALTGGISMGLELLASRSLALIFGSSLQSFAVVLIAFILGISAGSAWIASPRRSGKTAEKTAVWLLCAAGVWVTLLVFNLERWVDFYQFTRTGLGRTDVGYVYQLILSTAMSMMILGVPAACIGAVLPLMMRIVSTAGGPLGSQVGRLLTWNTLGAVVGTLVTGFGLMPLLGLRVAFGVLALLLALTALSITLRQGWRTGIAVTIGAGSFAICLLSSSEANWQNVMSSGVFRIWEAKYDPQLMPVRKRHIAVRFYQDAPDATVSVEEVDGIIAPASLGLRINGKPDASTGVDLSTQFLLAHLPLLNKPKAKNVFVLGLGSGITAGAVLSYPVTRVVVAENCQPVISAAHLFRGWNRNVLDSPRVRIELEDARTVLKLHPDRYDVIITEPSNPWTVGVGDVFSREFYELAARRLNPGGIICQWFHVYEMNDDILKLVLRTLSSVFPYLEIWDTRNGDIVMLGSQTPWRTGPEVFRQGFTIDRVRTDMAMININSPDALLARQVASQNTGFAIPGPGRMQSDLFPILEYAAPKAFFLGEGTQLLDQFDERTRQQLLAPEEKNLELHSLSQAEAQYVFSDFSTINGELYGCLFGYPSSANIPCVFQTPQPLPPPGADGSAVAGAEKAFQAGDLTQAEALITLALKQNPNDAQASYVMRVIEREKKLTHNGATVNR